MTETRRLALWSGSYLAVHLLMFVIGLPILAVTDLLVGDGWWVHWALLGWGAALLVHAFFVFGSHRSDHDLADDQQGAA